MERIDTILCGTGVLDQRLTLTAAEADRCLREAAEVAWADAKAAGARHAIYGAEYTDGGRTQLRLYVPAVLLDDDTFYARADACCRANPGTRIHAHHIPG